MVHPDAHLAHGDWRQDVALRHRFPNAIRIISAICQQHLGFWQVVRHHQVKPQTIRRLTCSDLRSHRQAVRVDAEVDLGREVGDGPENSPLDCFPIGRS